MINTQTSIVNMNPVVCKINWRKFKRFSLLDSVASVFLCNVGQKYKYS